MEEWRDIKGYEGKYQVSNLGNVRSLDRVQVYSNGRVHTYKGQQLKLISDGKGYLYVSLGKHNNKSVHRLVAETFLPNPDNLPEVNHKDENGENNCVDNLEWCSKSYNINYGTRNQRCYEAFRKPVLQLSPSGEVIKEWDSISEANLFFGGYRGGNIPKVLNGEREMAYGYKWIYAD